MNWRPAQQGWRDPRVLVPEAFCTLGGLWVAPRGPGQHHPPLDDELGYDDRLLAERAWVRPATPQDVAERGCIAEDPLRDSCGRGCGCWMLCDSRDPRRAEPVWVIH